jgi:hypothetical protein
MDRHQVISLGIGRAVKGAGPILCRRRQSVKASRTVEEGLCSAQRAPASAAEKLSWRVVVGAVLIVLGVVLLSA